MHCNIGLMAKPLQLHEDRLFPAEPTARGVAQRLYREVADLPIISPHGHTDPAWFARNAPFTNATELLLAPDHYLYRMLYSQGVGLAELGVPSRSRPVDRGPARRVAPVREQFHLFHGTPSSLWLNYVFAKVFELKVQLEAETADHYFNTIGEKLAQDAVPPARAVRSLQHRSAGDHRVADRHARAHRAIAVSGWQGRVITAYRPDPVVDPEHEAFNASLERFGELTDEDVHTWRGYLEAHRMRRAVFAKAGATSTDHGHPTAATADLSSREAERLFARITRRKFLAADAELFRAAMLVEMARMSLDDGLVMQIHPGAFRNHNRWLFAALRPRQGRRHAARTEYVHALKPLLDRFGNERALTLILFTLDESTYSRELAPLAGHYPVLRLGPAWWFHDSPEGMRRFREQTTETAGFYNTVGFNDDTRAFLSIPARHDVARRVDCASSRGSSPSTGSGRRSR